jgi:phosphate transport system substrate-binding protein
MYYLKSLFVLVLALSSLTARADGPLLRLAGSNTIGASLAPALVENWLTQRGVTGIRRADAGDGATTVSGRDRSGAMVTVEIQAHGSGTAFTSLAKGQADVGMASRPISAEEVARLAPLGNMASVEAEYVLGNDGIAVVTHPGNAVAALDRPTLARIFSGEVKEWSQVGGGSGPIHLYALDENSGTWDTFRSLVLGDRHLAPGVQRLESSAELARAVAADPGAIGFVGLAHTGKARVVAVADKGIRPLQPNSVSVATEDYALSRRLFLYVPTKVANPLAREFAAFAVSAPGQAIVAREGFVSQEVVAVDEAVPADAPAEYREAVKNARRLTVNFRFLPGAAYPDNKAMRDVERLAAFMHRPENEKRELILCGFSDGGEIAALNALNLSIERADQMTDMLLRASLRPRVTRGFGAAMAVAADDTAAGRDRNRRVEVWLR